MKANELMIGDWVRPIGCNPFRIGSVLGEMVCNDSDTQTWCEDEIEPVPLTPEILEKNGFEKQGFDGWLLVKRMGDGLAWSILWRTDCPSPHLWIDSYSSQTGSFSSFAVNYVYQLQHALRLCGIEKGIVI